MYIGEGKKKTPNMAVQYPVLWR